MKTLKLIFTTLYLSCFIMGLAQEKFFHRYEVKKFLDFEDDGLFNYDFSSLKDENVSFLIKEVIVPYYDLSKSQQESIDRQLMLVKGGLTKQIELLDLNGNTLIIDRDIVENENLLEILAGKIKVPSSIFENYSNNEKTFKAWVLFEKNRLYVNLWPFKNTRVKRGLQNTVLYLDDTDILESDKNKEAKEVLFYELTDDQIVKLDFQEWYMTAISVPIKYRFSGSFNGNDELGNEIEKNYSETFSSSFNLSLFAGKTWGHTKFQHRKKVGNNTYVVKNSFGGFIGSAVEELNQKNTNDRPEAPSEGETRKIGLFSMGLGYVKSWNKIAIGLFGGLDLGVGEDANVWNYHGEPWLGIGFGYDLFKL